MNNHKNILADDKNIISELKHKVEVFKEHEKLNEFKDNEKLNELLDFLVKNKEIIKSISYLKKKILIFINEMYINYDAELIGKYYYKIFNKHINNLVRYNSNTNNDINVLLKYIQYRFDTHVEKQEILDSNIITQVTI